MTMQGRTDFTNFPFIISGLISFVRDSITLLRDSGRSAVLALYTVMARVSVTISATGVATEGNTGTGTVTAVALAAGGTPRVGAWLLECVTKVANGGVFKLTDPGGNIIANDITCTVASTGATVFFIAGMTFTITDATDFEVGDEFTITVTASTKWVPFDPDGVNGSQIPRGILMVDSVTAAALAAADVTDQCILVGGCCVVDDAQIIFDDGVTTLATVLEGGNTVRDALADLGIYCKPTINIDLLET